MKRRVASTAAWPLSSDWSRNDEDCCSLILGGALIATACSTTAADSEAVADGAAINGVKPKAAQSRPKATAVPRYREVTIPSGIHAQADA